MENRLRKRNERRSRRLARVRNSVRGTAEKPRMSVFKSNRHLTVQMIDDDSSKTLFSVSTMTDSVGKKSKEAAKQIGLKVAELAKNKNIQEIVFDRGFHKYHGLLAELANSAREAGLQF